MAAKREEILGELKEKLGSKIVDVFEKNARRIYIEVKPEDIPKATKVLFKGMGARFQIATGIDTPTAIEILYHWAFDSLDCLVIVKTKLNRDNPVIDSLSSICVATEWIEREMWELLGITFKGHPDMRHLLLLDDWPEGKYPLRRDYTRE